MTDDITLSASVATHVKSAPVATHVQSASFATHVDSVTAYSVSLKTCRDHHVSASIAGLHEACLQMLTFMALKYPEENLVLTACTVALAYGSVTPVSEQAGNALL